MNNRLNTKFIVILSSALIILCAGVAIIAWVAISGDAERQAEIGRTAEKAGDFKEAISRYGRSISKDPMNLEYYDDYERALLQIVPTTQAEARERYGQQYLQLAPAAAVRAKAAPAMSPEELPTCEVAASVARTGYIDLITVGMNCF